MKESTKERDSSKRLGRNQNSAPPTQTRRKARKRRRRKPSMKERRVTETYHSQTCRKGRGGGARGGS